MVLEKPLDSLAGMAFDNRQALEYFLAEPGGVCALVSKTCCTYINVSGKVETKVASFVWGNTQGLLTHAEEIKDVNTQRVKLKWRFNKWKKEKSYLLQREGSWRSGLPLPWWNAESFTDELEEVVSDLRRV